MSRNHFRKILSLAGIITLLGIVLFLLPTLIALYHQIRGGQLLVQALASEARQTRDALVCADGPMTTDQSRALVHQAVDFLERSISSSNTLSHSYLLLGRAYCLLDESGSAVQAYQQFVLARPENPTGHMELGFGLEASCANNSGKNEKKDHICSDPVIESQILEEWSKSSLVLGDFIGSANDAFQRQDYSQAIKWYRRASLFSDQLPFEHLFKWAIASVVVDHTLPLKVQESITVYSATNSYLIQAEELYWMRAEPAWGLSFGQQMGKVEPAYPGVGVFWWMGRAVAFIDVSQPGAYKILVSAQDSPPGPIHLQIEKDLLPVDQLTLSNADMSWNVLETATMLNKGIHLIGINFLEDNGDAIVDWIRLTSIE